MGDKLCPVFLAAKGATVARIFLIANFILMVQADFLAAMSSLRSDSVSNAMRLSVHPSVRGHSCFRLPRGVYMVLASSPLVEPLIRCYYLASPFIQTRRSTCKSKENKVNMRQSNTVY